ncbi:MAG: Hpt domain-containing protein [Spirochaetota bacterium]
MSDKNIFDKAALLSHIGENHDFIKQLIEESISVIPPYMDDIRKAITDKNLPLAAKAAHRLKGGLSTISALAAAEAAAALEKSAAAGNMDLANSQFPILEKAIEATLDFLRKEL